MRIGQDRLDIATAEVPVLHVEPNTIKPKMGGVFNKCRDIVPETTHPHSLIFTEPGQRFAFSHFR